MKYLKYLVVFFVVASASFLAIGLFSPTISYESTVLVNKPVAHSFAVFNNPFNMKKWMPGFKSVKMVSGIPNTIGSKNQLIFEEDGKEIIIVEEVTEYEQNKVYAFDLTSDFVNSKIKITFQDVGGKTRITATTEATGNNVIFRSMFVLMKSHLQDRDQEAYTNLKDVIETTESQNSLLLDFILNQG